MAAEPLLNQLQGDFKMGRTRNPFVAILVLIAMLASTSPVSFAQGDALESGFVQPPESAKPRVWWHWLNGNVTKEGITADLEWMKRVGIGGMQMFDGNLGTPVFVDKRLVWMTPEWKDAFKHAGAEADRLGLEMSMAASGGWSETAGPWVKPEEAMKKVVWSETEVKGPKKFSGVLAHPPTVNGRFQNIQAPADLDFPPQPMPGSKPQPPLPPAPPDPTFYGDSAVLAFRVPEKDVKMADSHPKVTSNGGSIDGAKLMDGDVANLVSVPYAEQGQPAWVQYEFAQPYRAQAFTIAVSAGSFFGASIPDGDVQASQDGRTWSTLVTLPGPGGDFAVSTYSFPEISAKYYRVRMNPAPPNPFAAFLGIPQAKEFKIAELEFHSAPRVNHWEEKAGFANMQEYESQTTSVASSSEVVARKDIVDLTSKMGKDGTLNWEVPAGRWVIMRMGYSLTGEKNHPATREATGYEVDKLSHKDVENYARQYVEMISGAMGQYFGKSFRSFLMDSWEANNQNWTDDMIEQFRTRRGYDPTPFLPVLTGRVIESADVSDRFLWDFRRTIADLLAENHYRTAREYFNQHGVGLYAEAMGVGMPTIGDGLLNKGQVDVPMGEFWTPLPGQADEASYLADVREAASASHIYGKPFTATESFTSMPMIPAWAQSPFYLKRIGDRFFTVGVNRIVFHTSDQQPFVDDAHKPGMTLGPFGQHYTRNITWAEQAVAWNTYLARCSYMLQQGKYSADLAYYYGEGAPATVPFWKEVHPAPPDGYSYDYVNADVLLNGMSVRDGRIELPTGMSYRVLVLPDDVDQLTLPVARKIRDLVKDGAIVIAPKPAQPPSLSGYPAADAELRAIANEVWGPLDGKGATEHEYGKGKVYWGKAPAEVLEAEKTAPDFLYNKPQFDTTLVWLHRHLADADVYFVSNQKERAEDVQTSFRMEGKEAELWHADTGMMEPAEYSIANGRTAVPLHQDP